MGELIDDVALVFFTVLFIGKSGMGSRLLDSLNSAAGGAVADVVLIAAIVRRSPAHMKYAHYVIRTAMKKHESSKATKRKELLY